MIGEWIAGKKSKSFYNIYIFTGNLEGITASLKLHTSLLAKKKTCVFYSKQNFPFLFFKNFNERKKGEKLTASVSAKVENYF